MLAKIDGDCLEGGSKGIVLGHYYSIIWNSSPKRSDTFNEYGVQLLEQR